MITYLILRKPDEKFIEVVCKIFYFRFVITAVIEPSAVNRVNYQHIGFLDYLTEVRIQAACELLTDPLRPTAEVAGMVGYEDASYFARAFKKKTGLTPTQYRREAARRHKEQAP